MHKTSWSTTLESKEILYWHGDDCAFLAIERQGNVSPSFLCNRSIATSERNKWRNARIIFTSGSLHRQGVGVKPRQKINGVTALGHIRACCQLTKWVQSPCLIINFMLVARVQSTACFSPILRRFSDTTESHMGGKARLKGTFAFTLPRY